MKWEQGQTTKQHLTKYVQVGNLCRNPEKKSVTEESKDWDQLTSTSIKLKKMKI